MTKVERYRAFCEIEKSIPIFSQAWWLDSVCDSTWGVCLVEKNAELVASQPYVTRKRYGFTLLTQPPLTQNLGPWVKASKAKYCKALGQEKGLMQALIAQLPKHHYFKQNWHYDRTNWLPFYWKGFQQTTGYTYVIDDISSLDKVWSNTQANIKTDIRKARDRFKLHVRTDLQIKEFIKLNKLTFSRQGKALPYRESVIINIFEKASMREQCKVFVAQDEAGQNHAGVFVIWDESSAYYLMGGGDPKLRNSGAMSLCMWEAIKFSSTVTKRFDFEGSMIEPVERFFRGFGAVQKPYLSISKTNSKLLKTVSFLRGLSKK